MSHWASHFFGLTDEYKIIVHQQIYDLITVGFDFYSLYTMPVYLRNFYIRYAYKRNEDERKMLEKSRGISEATPSSRKNVPDFVANKFKK